MKLMTVVGDSLKHFLVGILLQKKTLRRTKHFSHKNDEKVKEFF
jgi:hypothetical protein